MEGRASDAAPFMGVVGPSPAAVVGVGCPAVALCRPAPATGELGAEGRPVLPAVASLYSLSLPSLSCRKAFGARLAPAGVTCSSVASWE